MSIAHRLRHRVTIERKSVTRNSIGEEVTTWEAFANSVPAAVNPIRGREFFAAAQTQDAADYRVIIRPLAGLDRTMRVMFNGTPLDIVSVIDIESRGREMELMCISGVRNGI